MHASVYFVKYNIRYTLKRTKVCQYTLNVQKFVLIKYQYDLPYSKGTSVITIVH